ncbi:hypothetical protein GBA52_009050 [Prunus armeniaca]|nr:hypothetical protein GBA52_009050 [Prunus armeniaca]
MQARAIEHSWDLELWFARNDGAVRANARRPMAMATVIWFAALGFALVVPHGIGVSSEATCWSASSSSPSYAPSLKASHSYSSKP